MDEKIREFMIRLEREILAPGVAKGVFTSRAWAPVKKQRLHSSDFGKLIGSTALDFPEILVVDYYGLIKRSAGFISKVEDLRSDGVEAKSMFVPIAYFAGIKMEHLARSAPDLIPFFSEFKKTLVELRAFKKS